MKASFPFEKTSTAPGAGREKMWKKKISQIISKGRPFGLTVVNGKVRVVLVLLYYAIYIRLKL